MKPSTKKLAWLILLAMLTPGQPFVAQSRNNSDDKHSPSAVAQKTETIKWKFNGADAGTNTYQTHPDGKFESVSELNIVGTSLKSRLAGRFVDGVITEFEMVNQQGGTEVKVSVKDGKARILVGEKDA